MGAAFSGGSLCRIVGGVEIVVSATIIGFGSQTLYNFYSIDDSQFKKEFDKIQYSSITAITQGTLTILASLLILFASRQKVGEKPLQINEEDSEDDFSPDEQEREGNRGDFQRKQSVKSQISSQSTRRQEISLVKRKLALLYRLWLGFSILSIGLLLVVFFLSFRYCIQTQGDKKAGENLMESGKKVSHCYADKKQTLDLRQSISNLYSYCLVNIFALSVFMLVVYYQLKRVTRIHHVKEDKQKVLQQENNENGGGDGDGQRI